MTAEFMENFTTEHIVIMVSSLIIGFYCIKQAKAGVYSKYKWLMLIVGVAFFIDMGLKVEKLYLVPLIIVLITVFVVNLLVDLGKIKKTGDYEEITMEKAEAMFTTRPRGQRSQEAYMQYMKNKQASDESKSEIIDAEIVENEDDK